MRPASVFKKEEMKPKAKPPLPIILPMKRSLIQAARGARIAMNVVGTKLPANDPIRLALDSASSPRNIRKVVIKRG